MSCWHHYSLNGYLRFAANLRNEWSTTCKRRTLDVPVRVTIGIAGVNDSQGRTVLKVNIKALKDAKIVVRFKLVVMQRDKIGGLLGAFDIHVQLVGRHA